MIETSRVSERGHSLPVSAILLAGGASRRMGGLNKALLKVGRVTIVERVAHTLASIFSEVVVITNTPEAFAFLGLPMHPDLKLGQGSLGGLYTGLTVCSTGHGFLAACDMPFLCKGCIEHMVTLIDRNDVVIPRVRGWLEPLHAIYSSSCLPHIKESLDAGNLQINSFFPKVQVREVDDNELGRYDPQFLFTVNVNRPEDLNTAQEIARKLDQE
jgi:molybdopterin-guanine dinucleotide biosynthesis protein A